MVNHPPLYNKRTRPEAFHTYRKPFAVHANSWRTYSVIGPAFIENLQFHELRIERNFKIHSNFGWRIGYDGAGEGRRRNSNCGRHNGYRPQSDP